MLTKAMGCLCRSTSATTMSREINKAAPPGAADQQQQVRRSRCSEALGWLCRRTSATRRGIDMLHNEQRAASCRQSPRLSAYSANKAIACTQ
eukprot:scaffold66324_cov18-Tisochrysis_lutea.AAC.1